MYYRPFTVIVSTTPQPVALAPEWRHREMYITIYMGITQVGPALAATVSLFV